MIRLLYYISLLFTGLALFAIILALMDGELGLHMYLFKSLGVYAFITIVLYFIDKMQNKILDSTLFVIIWIIDLVVSWILLRVDLVNIGILAGITILLGIVTLLNNKLNGLFNKMY